MRPVTLPAFTFGALVLMLGAIAAVWAFQFAGYMPCPLCLQQRELPLLV